MKVNRLACGALFLFLVSCGNSAPKEKQTDQKKSVTELPGKKEPANPVTKTDSPKLPKEQKAYYESLLVPKTGKFAGYTFEFGYSKYNEEEFGFENPGYLRVLRDGKVIFKDQFKGEGEVYLKSLGRHDLAGKKLVFTLNYGTPACDYNQASRYYIVNPDHKVSFIEEKYSSCGGDGYACHVFNHIFPEDSLGKINTLVFTEGYVYNEHDQEDQIDTTHVLFTKTGFKVKKPAKS